MIPVSLIAVDCVDPALAVAVMRSADSLPFAQRLLLSDERPNDLPSHIEWGRIPRIESTQEYCRFCLKELHRYTEAGHVLTVHSDGFVLRPELWSDDWLQWDYIGAPWPTWAGYARGARVGNSGFCLRSKRLLEETALLPTLAEPWQDDLVTCIVARKRLEAVGMKFAPPDVAVRFSFEQECDDLGNSVGTVFGFHGRLTPQTTMFCDSLFRQVNGGKLRLVLNYYRDSHYPRRVEIDECLRANCGPGLFDEVLVVTHPLTPVPAFRRIRLARDERYQRATFAQHFAAADAVAARADVNVVANADVEFDPETIDVLRMMGPGEFWCLSRWERGEAMPPPEYRWCQDVWAWRGKCRIGTEASFPPGFPGCENRLAYLAHAAGYRVRNPSLSVKTIHVHETGLRRYPATEVGVRCPDRVPAPYLYVEPHRRGEAARITIDPDGPNLPEKIERPKEEVAIVS